MKILFLTTAHNSLSQRAFIELTDRGHHVSIELALDDARMIEAVGTFEPALIVAPMLKSAIPEQIWRTRPCIIVHPGIKGDRGPSSLDWAISTGAEHWGVTLLEAIAEMDAGDIWASETFAMRPRPVAKSSLYRNEVTEAAIRGMLDMLERHERGTLRPQPLDYGHPEVVGELRPIMKQEHRAIDWRRDSTHHIARRIRAADSSPGVLDGVLGREYFLFGAHEEDRLRGEAGTIIAQRDGAICRATVDGAVWISHLKPRGKRAIKLPATLALGELAHGILEAPYAVDVPADHRSFREIRYEERNGVGHLWFDFYNGAMSTEQCKRLRAAYRIAAERPTQVLVLWGGRDFWSNGIHLNVIAAASSVADESWANINAIDDLVHDVLVTTSKLVVAAMRGNAGAGGVMMALAADHVFARSGVVLNPHYKSMGGLYGSEYWTYTLPRRVGAARALELTEACLPVGTRAAIEMKLIDDAFGDSTTFEGEVVARAEALVRSGSLGDMIRTKRAQRWRDERDRPLASYRAAELARMHDNFYGPDPSYHEACTRFVHKEAPTHTPHHLATHRTSTDVTSPSADSSAIVTG